MSPRKPRLLVVINNFPPDRGGAAAVYGDMCDGLSARGFDVTVRCAYPYYPEWKDKSGRNGWRIWRYDERLVHVERYGLFIPSNPNSFAQRLLHELSFVLSLLRSLHRGRSFDAVMVYCPAFSCLVFGVVNKLFWRRPLWLNVQDLAANAAVASGLVRRSWLSRLLQAVQTWFFNRADVWSTISPVMLERLEAMRRREQPLLLVPNWLDQTLAQEIQKQSVDQPVSCHVPVRLLYAGNIGRKQNLLALLELLAKSPAQFQFTVHGNGAQARDVERWISQSNDPRFRFGPFLDAAAFAGVLAATDYFVITETDDAGASFMPSKLIAGIASGKPILAVCDESSPLGREMSEHQLGPMFGWHAGERIAAWLITDANHAAAYRRWVENAKSRFVQYEREAIIDRIVDGLRQFRSVTTALDQATTMCS